MERYDKDALSWEMLRNIKKGNIKNLGLSVRNFECVQREEGMQLTCDYPIHVIDCCYDEANGQYIFAVKVNIRGPIFYTDYVILDKNFQIIEVLQEEYGNTCPQFLIAPDKSVWVRVFSLAHDYTKEIIVPVHNRSQIKKVKSQSIRIWEQSTLWERNFLGIGYNNRNAKSGLLCFQFDKKGLYKKRDRIKTDITQESILVVHEGKLYIQNMMKDKSKLRFTQINDKGKDLKYWESTLPEQIQLVYAMPDKDSLYSFVVYDCIQNNLRNMIFDEEGSCISDKLIYNFMDGVRVDKLPYGTRDEEGTGTLVYKTSEAYGFIQWNDEKQQVASAGQGCLKMVNTNSEIKIFGDMKKNYIVVTPPNIYGNAEKSVWILRGI